MAGLRPLPTDKGFRGRFLGTLLVDCFHQLALARKDEVVQDRLSFVVDRLPGCFQETRPRSRGASLCSHAPGDYRFRGSGRNLYSATYSTSRSSRTRPTRRSSLTSSRVKGPGI